MFLFLVLLPSPSFYFYHKDTRNHSKREIEFSREDFEENPLAIDSGDGEDNSKAPASRAVVFKFQRDNKDLLAKNKQLQKDIAALRRNKSLPDSNHDGSQADVEMFDGDADTGPATKKHPVDELKDFATDESLSEEARAAAKKARETLVASQIALTHLRSEEVFSNQILTQLGAKHDDVATSARQDLLGWLSANRLLRYAEIVMQVAGKDAASSDLVHLTEDNIETISEPMAHVEKLRLNAALQALREKGQPAEPAEAEAAGPHVSSG